MDSTLRALIFDLDDTLVVEEASAEAAFIETGELARARYGLDPRALHRTVRKTCRQLWYAFPSHPYCKTVGISSWEGLWAEFLGPDPNLKRLHDWAPTYRFESWHAALLCFGIRDTRLASELAETFPLLRRRRNEVYGDTVPALDCLVQRYPLAILTNGAPDLQRRKLEGAGLARYFQHVLVSGDVGIGKPHPDLFRILLKQMEAAAEAALMIGNNLVTDIQGAHAAGIRAVWVNRSGAPHDESVIPEWTIGRLPDLSAILTTHPQQTVPPATT